jgi:hypothetical protein
MLRKVIALPQDGGTGSIQFTYANSSTTPAGVGLQHRSTNGPGSPTAFAISREAGPFSSR